MRSRRPGDKSLLGAPPRAPGPSTSVEYERLSESRSAVKRSIHGRISVDEPPISRSSASEYVLFGGGGAAPKSAQQKASRATREDIGFSEGSCRVSLADTNMQPLASFCIPVATTRGVQGSLVSAVRQIGSDSI